MLDSKSLLVFAVYRSHFLSGESVMSAFYWHRNFRGSLKAMRYIDILEMLFHKNAEVSAFSS